MDFHGLDEHRTDLWRDVARGIFEEHCVLDKRESEGGNGFVLSQNRGVLRPLLSPFYINLRARPEGRMSEKLIQKTSLLILGMMIRRNIFHVLIAGVPNAGTAFATAITERSGGLMSILPMTREFREFSVGAPEKGWNTVVPIENVVTSGGSLILAINSIRKAGFFVDNAFVVVEREDGARFRLRDMGVNLHSAFTLKGLMDFGVENRLITEAFRDECLSFRPIR